MEESYRKQKQFLTDAGHELKTPLTIIDANTEVLEMEIGSSKWLDSTRNQVIRLTNMVKQFTALAKMDEAQGLLQKARFSLSQVLNETVDLFIPVATSTHRTLQVSCAEDLYYVGDKEQFRQLFCLLLDNAIKYSTPDSRIELTLCKHGKHLCFTIFNECKGIAKGSQDILFERFYRSDSSRNSSTGGSGIGLSIAHSIVENHKGSIHAESTDGKSLQIKVLL